MKFWQSVAFTAPNQLVEIARGAEAAGFEGVLLSEHLFVPDAYAAHYPYSESGTPDFDAQSPFPDPWVTMTAMAAATSRLRFATMVYILPLRHPLEVAKLVGTASIFSDGRAVLGAGAGWMREEFEVLGVDFATRGKRFDECIEILRQIWRGGMAEYHGEIFSFDRLQMSPAPPHPIPIYIGGASKPALRRAARLGDGWLGAGNTPEQAEKILVELRRLREEVGRIEEPFDAIVPLVTPLELDTLRRLSDLGATG
ncbi:MAG: LLM class F420-dependent oxidoreductase, partial [Deltaproteobacteria bacterium]|nr:LLM class F420-dependent oxidoreductase [Deltaproteobacteria bacterium]